MDTRYLLQDGLINSPYYRQGKENYTMTKDEKRFLRRELISFYLQQNAKFKKEKRVYFRYNVKYFKGRKIDHGR